MTKEIKDPSGIFEKTLAMEKLHNAKSNKKTSSQKLRFALFGLYTRSRFEVEFDKYYEVRMRNFIDFVNRKQTDNSDLK